MVGILFPVVGGWLLLTVLGVAVLAPLRRSGLRQVWLPAAPLLGAALTAVVLSSTSWVLPVRWGVLVVIAVAIGAVVLAVVRKSRFWAFSRGNIVVAVLCWMIGGAGALVALLPNLIVGDGRVVSPNNSHDAFYYASESGWFTIHAMLPGPLIGASPALSDLVPAFGPAVSSYYLPLRMGQPMVQSAISVILGRDELTTTTTVIALWVMLLAGATFVGGRMLRLGSGVCLGVAIASVSSALLMYQAYSQNVDSLLGVSLAVGAIGAVLAASQGRSPRWPAVLLLASLVSVYVEYAAFVAPTIIGGVLLHRSLRYGVVLFRALQILVLAVLVAPMAWMRGADSLLHAPYGGLDEVPSQFASDGPWAVANRILGLAPLTEGLKPNILTVLLGLTLAAGCLLAVVVGRNRGAWAALLVVGVGYVILLTVEGRGYTQSRAVTLLLPLLLLACAAGWDGALRAQRRGGGVRTAPVIGWLLVPILLVWVVANVNTAQSQLDPIFLAARHVDSSYDEAAGWVSELGGPEGQDVSVLVPDFFQQLWINFELRDDSDVSYPSLNPSYLRVSRFWAGEVDRYLLVGSGVQVDADPATVIRSNSKFRMLDTSAGGVTVVAPYNLSGWFPHAQKDGVFLGGIGSQLLVIRSATSSPHLATSLAVSVAPEPVPIVLSGDHGTEAAAVLENSGQPVPMTVLSPTEIFTIEPGTTTGPQQAQIQLLGVNDGP